MDIYKQIQPHEKEIRRSLAVLDQVTPSEVILPRKLDHRLRLLNLQVWSLKYRVELIFILRILLKKRFAKVRQDTTGSLGVATAALCSKSSEQFIEEEVLAAPEHRLPIIPRETLPLRSSNCTLAYYHDVMTFRRRENLRQEQAFTRSSRNWRGKHG